MRVRSCFAVFGLLSLAGKASAHATLVVPDPRGQDGNLWYQVGCVIGCTCSGKSGKELYTSPSSFGCQNPMEPTNNDPATRTWNVQNKSGTGDFGRYSPWRAPGFAIPLNGCGIASGFKDGGFTRVQAGGEKSFYHSAVPDGYQAGDPGTLVPELPGKQTVWSAGGVAEVEFAIDVNHGGGYQYRLCPKSAGDITEKCFQANPLAFASKTHIIRYTDKSRKDFTIPAVDVTEGVNPPEAAWRRFPIPACNCDLGTGCQAQKAEDEGLYNKDMRWAYENTTESFQRENPGCPTGLQFPKSWDDGYGYYGPDNTGIAKNDNGGGAKNTEADELTKKCNALGEAGCADDKSCRWYEKSAAKGKESVCWADLGEKRLLQEEEEEHEHRYLQMDDGTWRCSKCGTLYVPKENDGMAFEDQPKDYKCPVCSSPKSFFKPTEEYEDELGRKPAKGYTWHIVDQLVVPTAPGDYVLSWRWDCEQTVQIWTNCADITVSDKQDKDPAASSASFNSALVLWMVLAVSWCV